MQYQIQLRQGMLASSSEWKNVKSAIDDLILKVNLNPDDLRSKNALGLAYIQESRISGNHSYYDAAAIRLFNDVLQKQPENFEALIGKSTVLLSQHHFIEAIPIAKKAQQVSQQNSAAYGVLTDAYAETGEYESAIEMADMMTSMRPDIRSYSRISYMREITGNYEGAIEAMKMAIAAGQPGLEQTEWCRVQLGQLYENTGDLLHAKLCYDQSVYHRPSYAWAYAGQARIEKAQGNYKAAIDLIQHALAILPDPSFELELAELYRIVNRQEEAAIMARNAVEHLGGLKNEEAGQNHGHYADRELAYAYLACYDYQNAYKHALIEYNRRPKNIEVNQCLGWVLYKLGKFLQAGKYMDVALRTNSKNPVLLFEAGMIKSAAGQKEEGRRLMAEALEQCPYISPLLRWESKKLLAEK